MRLEDNRRRRAIISVVVAVSVIHLALASARAEPVEPVLVGLVTRVVDGDTADVQLASGPIRVRLDSIDAPEMSQPYGPQSRKALAALIESKTVELEPIEQDKYERIVAVVWLGSLNVNLEMTRLGMAWAFRRYMRDRIYCDGEGYARRERIGLWAGANGNIVAPWDWRAWSRGEIQIVTDFANETVEGCVANMGKN